MHHAFKKLLTSVFVCWHFVAIGQPEVHTLTGDLEQVELWRNYEFLVDSSSSLTLQKVRASSNWERSAEIKNFGFTDVAVWARYKIEVPDDLEAYVVSQTVTMDSIYFYALDGDSLIQSAICGDHIDYDSRQVEYQACAFELSKEAANQTIYLRFKTSGPLTLPVTVREKSHFQRSIFYETYMYGIHFGIFFLVAIYHFMLFLFLRDRVLLTYAIYVMVAGVVALVMNGLTTQLFFRDNGAAVDGIMVFLTGVSVFFYSWFVMDFLSVKKRSRGLYYLFLTIMGLGVCMAIAHFFVPISITSGLAGLLSLLYHGTALFVSIYFFIKGYQDTGLLLMASTVFLVMAILFALRVVGVIPVSFLTENGIEIGAAIEVILISVSIGNRFRRTDREKKSLAALGQFKEAMTNMIAHDLKNPLSVILNQTGQETNKLMAKEMLNLVNNMIETHRLESTNVEVKTESILISDLFYRAETHIKPLLDQRRVSLKKILPENTFLFADQELIIRVLINLLTNAIKYAPLNSEVILSASSSKGKVKLSVQDFGQGIPSKDIDRLFGSFEQIDPKNSGGIKSNGLGLTYCKLAVEAHQSAIEVDSNLGKGTTFSFELPESAGLAPVVSPNESQKTKAPLLSEAEREILRSKLISLKSMKVYQVSEIEELLKPLINQTASDEWANQLISTIYNGNQEGYDHILEELLNNRG